MAGTCALVPRSRSADEHRLWSCGGVAVIVVLCLAVETVSALVTAEPVRSWYPDVAKPAWTPPDWVFGPVWTALYLMMAVAGSLVWLARDREDACCPMAAFGLQLTANLAWSVLFFGMHSPLAAFLDILLLWVLVGATTVHFFGVSRLAGWLFVPYWVWVTYAAALNGSIVFLAA